MTLNSQFFLFYLLIFAWHIHPSSWRITLSSEAFPYLCEFCALFFVPRLKTQFANPLWSSLGAFWLYQPLSDPWLQTLCTCAFRRWRILSGLGKKKSENEAGNETNLSVIRCQYSSNEKTQWCFSHLSSARGSSQPPPAPRQGHPCCVRFLPRRQTWAEEPRRKLHIIHLVSENCQWAGEQWAQRTLQLLGW